MALELSKNLAVSALQVEYPAPQSVVITIEFTTNTTGVFCVSLALLLPNGLVNHTFIRNTGYKKYFHGHDEFLLS